DTFEQQVGVWGVRAHCVGSAAEAREAVRSAGPFDCAFLDARMPDDDAAALARQIREIDARLPLVLCAPVGTRQSEDTFAAYVSKPLKMSQLFDTFATLFGDADAAPAPAEEAP